LRAPGGPLANFQESTVVTARGIQFVLYDRNATRVEVVGSWNNWQAPASMLSPRSNGIWLGGIDPLPPGRYGYKFLLDGTRWLDDPTNPRKISDGYGGWNSLLVIE
jgi:1,4-alpha-glucan branching enzyme